MLGLKIIDLLNKVGSPMHIRTIASELGETIEGIRNELLLLCREGYVLSDRTYNFAYIPEKYKGKLIVHF